MQPIKNSKFKKAGAYLIELLIVVAGVSIAFQLNVWNDTRKSKEIEKHLLQSFIAENRLNQTEVDSTVAVLQYTMKINPILITLLQAPQPNLDSIRLNMAELYSISWPDITSTHLRNYLELESGTSDLREEMLALNTSYNSLRELTNMYIAQKQLKYFDYLSDAVDMTDGLKVIKKDKLFNVQFRNNLLIIYNYEIALKEAFDDIVNSQQKVSTLIDKQLGKL